MCVIVLKMPEATITKRTLKNCWAANKDGGGLMYVANGKLQIEKGYFGFRKIYRRFREVEREYPKSKIVIHFRIATSGGISANTCHPFYVNNDIGFAHNGILVGLGSNYLSDTQEFVHTVLKKLPLNFLSKQDIIDSLETYAIKSGSKFVFLDNDNWSLICNENMGHWEDGIWFSNYSYNWSYNTTNCYNSQGNRRYLDEYEFDYFRCSKCGVYESELRLRYDKIEGYICDLCDWIDKNKDDKTLFTSYECSMCQEEFDIQDGILLDNKVFYCSDCWNTLISTFTIECPLCGDCVTLKWDETCPSCYEQLTIDDYKSQFERLEFFNLKE